jgi:capsular exopolysaccharide synthesis family protein
MSRIHKALLKVKELQTQDLSEPGKRLSPLQKIDYVQTRVQSANPDILRQQGLVVGLGDDHERAQVFKSLRTRVQKVMKENGWKSLAVTSPSPGEGKTFVACNLAVAMSMEYSQSVALVDANLINPGVHRFFDISSTPGLLDVLENTTEVPDSLINPGFDRLVLLPGGNKAPNSAEILSSPRMAFLARQLRNWYSSRFIIYDLPAVLPTDDVLGASAHFDAVLLVVEDGVTTESGLRQALDQLGKGKVNLIGTVLNRKKDIRLPSGLLGTG